MALSGMMKDCVKMLHMEVTYTSFNGLESMAALGMSSHVHWLRVEVTYISSNGLGRIDVDGMS